MDKKITTIVLMILFILMLVVLNNLLKNETNTNVNTNTQQISYEVKNETNVNNEINVEEENGMEVLKVTSANFESEVLNSDKTVLIDFYADWCGPCKMLSPIVEEVAKENADIKVVKIDTDAEQDLAVKYGIMSIPTLVVIKNGEVANRAVGLISKTEILNLVK